MITRVQALIRGFLQRRKYKVKQLNFDKKTKYFKADENKETLAGTYSQASPIEKRTHTYKTGAVYSGDWKGGLRHGHGLMKWADGAVYEGEWAFNSASGQGKFLHTDGDIYEGKWANNKANGRGVYTNDKGARYDGQWKEDQ